MNGDESSSSDSSAGSSGSSESSSVSDTSSANLGNSDTSQGFSGNGDARGTGSENVNERGTSAGSNDAQESRSIDALPETSATSSGQDTGSDNLGNSDTSQEFSGNGDARGTGSENVNERGTSAGSNDAQESRSIDALPETSATSSGQDTGSDNLGNSDTSREFSESELDTSSTGSGQYGQTPDSMKPYERPDGSFNDNAWRRDQAAREGHETPDSMKPYERPDGSFDYDSWKQDRNTRKDTESGSDTRDASGSDYTPQSESRETQKEMADRSSAGDSGPADLGDRDVSKEFQNNEKGTDSGSDPAWKQNRHAERIPQERREEQEPINFQKDLEAKSSDKTAIESDKSPFPNIEGFDQVANNFNDTIKNKIENRIPPEHLEKIPSIIYDGKDIRDADGRPVFGTTNGNTNEIHVHQHPQPENSPTDVELTTFHEIAHPVYREYLTDVQRQEWDNIYQKSLEKGEGGVSEFSSDSKEDFCESYARYLEYPQFESAYPERSAFLKKIFY
jgi:hypothetical protein